MPRSPLSLATLCLALPALAVAGTAVITVNAANVTQTFIPLQAFGANAAFFYSKAGLNAITPQLRQTGARFIRYPGGSSSDDFHWNGVGAFNGQGHWVPDDTSYGLSWTGTLSYRGTTSSYGVPSKLSDGDLGTRWLSSADTDTPNAQWAYLDLGSVQSVNRIVIDWATPYATQFKVQVWNAPISYPPPYGSATDSWVDTSAGTLTGSGGSQSVTFTTTAVRCIRVLCMASSQAPAQYSIAELTLFNGATQRSQNVPSVTRGAFGGVPDQSWGTVSSTDIATAKDQVLDLDFESFMVWLQAYAPGARPVITVNFGTGSPQEAAAWVHYANVVRGYGIRDWEIGNEVEGNWETGGPVDARDYARRFIEFSQAMKAVDPGIRVYGPVCGNPYTQSNDQDGKYFIQAFIERLAADPGGDKTGLLDGIAFHWYPLYGTGNSEASLLGQGSNLQVLGSTGLPAMLGSHPSAATLPVLMTEFNAGIYCDLTVRQAAGLWLADWLGTFITQFGTRAHSNVWEALEGGDASTNAVGSSLGLFNGNNDAYLYQARPQARALELLNQRFAIPGDTAQHSLVQATSSQGLLSAYANKRPDGVLSLMIINKDPGNTFNTTVNLNGFSPAASAARWTWDATNYAWSTASLPYHADPDSPPTAGTEVGVASSFNHSFGPYSITVFQFTDPSLPTPTPSPTYSISPTPTPVPTWAPQVLIDDFEDPARNGAPPSRLNLWGGNWATNQIAGVQSGVSYAFPGLGSVNAAAWSLTVPAGGWANFQASLPTPFDAAAAGFVGLEFYAWGDGSTWRAMIQTQVILDYDQYGLNFSPPANAWTLVRIPFSAMSRQGWGGQVPAPPGNTTGSDIVGLQFAAQSTGALKLVLDNVGFYMASAPLPSNTASPTRTGTRTPTPTRSSTPTLSASTTASPSPSPSATGTPTETRTATDGPSPTVTASASATETASPSGTPSATSSSTPVPVSPTLTATPSPAPGPLEIQGAALVPHPVLGSGAQLKARLAGPTPRLKGRLYTQAYRRVQDLDLPGGGPGWVSLPLDLGMLQRNGIYFLELWPEDGGRRGDSVKLRIAVLR